MPEQRKERLTDIDPRRLYYDGKTEPRSGDQVILRSHKGGVPFWVDAVLESDDGGLKLDLRAVDSGHTRRSQPACFYDLLIERATNS